MENAYELEAGASLDGTYTLTGTIVSVDEAYSETYSNVTVTIAVEGASADKPIKCFRLKGEGAEFINVGAVITVSGTLTNYVDKNNVSTIEFATNCTLDSYTITNASKANYEKDALAIETQYENTATITLPTAGTTYTDVAIAWAVDHANASIANGVLTISQVSETTIVSVMATLTLGEVSVKKVIDIVVSKVAVGVEKTLATFEFGDNVDTTSHKDGSEISEGEEYTDGDYTLKMTGVSKVYDGANDAKGNSCIKLGTTKATAAFTFTVADDVDKVVIKVAGYKANVGKITINGMEYTVEKLSDNGEYMEISIDTTTTKTITVATTSSVKRAMIDSITYISVEEA